MSCFQTQLGNQKICHKNGIPSDRFYYNILDHMITAEFPHKNQCPFWYMGRPLETASNGQGLAEIGAVRSTQDFVFLHLP